MKLVFGEKQTAHAQRRLVDPDEVARGPGWIIVRRDGALELNVLTGGHGTPEGKLAIDPHALRALQADPAALDTVLRRYNV